MSASSRQQAEKGGRSHNSGNHAGPRVDARAVKILDNNIDRSNNPVPLRFGRIVVKEFWSVFLSASLTRRATTTVTAVQRVFRETIRGQCDERCADALSYFILESFKRGESFN